MRLNFCGKKKKKRPRGFISAWLCLEIQWQLEIWWWPLISEKMVRVLMNYLNKKINKSLCVVFFLIFVLLLSPVNAVFIVSWRLCWQSIMAYEHCRVFGCLGRRYITWDTQRQNREVIVIGSSLEAFGETTSEIIKTERILASIFLLCHTGHRT